MNHHSHFIYSEDERRKLQNPELILRSIGLKEGMCFIDVGANDGFFTVPAARIVGLTGKVYAIDTDQEALGRLVSKLEQSGIGNTEVIARAAENVNIGEGIADIIFYGTVLHDFKDPFVVLLNSKNMLKQDGIIYDFDWRKISSSIGPRLEIRFSQEYVNELAVKAGLKVETSETIDDNFYAVTMRKDGQI